MFTKFNLKDYNFKLLFLVLIAEIFGIVVINSASSSDTIKQIFGAVLGLGIIIFLSVVNYNFICKFYIYIYIFNLVMLLSVLLFGVEVNNAKRWILIGGANGIQFQPSEFAKIFMIIFISTILAKYYEKKKINTIKCLMLFAVSVAGCLILILSEPDLSTTLCLSMVLVTILFVSGLSYKLIGIVLIIAIPLSNRFLWYIQRPGQKLLKDYQANRILQFVNPSKYGADYSQQSNSIMAIGSGKLNGKGLNTSTIAKVKDANFISEQQTDFIFSVIGEELGFIGSVIIIAILLLIVVQCIKIARTAKDVQGMLIATGVGVLIAYQSFINISVATGIIPNTGIPLPFISYGLSSLISISAGIGMLLNISMQRRHF